MSNYAQSTDGVGNDLSGHDRRDGIRHDAARLGKVSARLIGGSEVTLVNFSNRGLLFESDSRLLIGARASVRLTTTDANLVVTGRVVRSRVKGMVNGALRYDAALALDAELSLTVAEAPPPGPSLDAHAMDAGPAAAPFDAATALPAPAADPEPPAAFDAPEEPVSMDLGADWPAADAADATDDDAVVQLYATVPHDLAELRRLANDNQW